MMHWIRNWFHLHRSSTHRVSILMGAQKKYALKPWKATRVFRYETDLLHCEAYRSKMLGLGKSWFKEKATEVLWGQEWDLALDESIESSHPLYIRAFLIQCDNAASEERCRDCAREIAKQQLGLRSIAPTESFWQGFESDNVDSYSNLRYWLHLEREKIQLDLISTHSMPALTHRALTGTKKQHRL